jgi:hypothetical protein
LSPYYQGGFGEADWDNKQIHLFEQTVHGDHFDEATTDGRLITLFDDALFTFPGGHMDRESQERLSEYLWEEYQIDFESAMDWEAWREWYEGG